MTRRPARPTDEAKFWIAVIPKTRVETAVAGGFAMFAHGREAPVRRVKPGDWLAYYSPRTVLNGGAEVRAFTAIGRIRDGDPIEKEMMGGHVGWARAIAYEKKARDADVYPLLDALSFVRDRQHWGLFFHRSIFSVPRADFAAIATAMGLDPARL